MCMCYKLQSSSDATHLAVFGAGSPTDLELIKWARLADQWAQGPTCLHLARSGIISMVYHAWLFTWALEVKFRSLCLCAMDLSKLLSSYYTFNCYLIHTSIYFIVGWGNGSEVKLLQRTYAWLPAPMLYNSQLSITPKGSMPLQPSATHMYVHMHKPTQIQSLF